MKAVLTYNKGEYQGYAGKPTLSGPTALVVAQTGAILDTYQKPPSMREEREREREKERYINVSYVHGTK